MAGEERTEQASPKKRQEARKKGQVAKSVEVNAAVVFLAGIYVLKAIGGGVVTQWQQFAAGYLQRAGHFTATITSVQNEMLQAGVGFVTFTWLFLAVVTVTGLAVNLLQTGFIFSSQALQPDFSRINVGQGIVRMFSQRAMVEVLKSLLKVCIIGMVIYTFFRSQGGRITQLIAVEPTQIGPLLAALCWDLLGRAALVLAGIAGADYIFQRWQFEKQLRMTKEEVKEEFKQTEGHPLIKSMLRHRQREAAQRRMMADVPRATVVLTNPTHLAVALRYEVGQPAAPLVVAKGQRLMAERIKSVARAHGIPVIENKPVARALYQACEVGQMIPAELYQAVAEIIAFVYRQAGKSPV